MYKRSLIFIFASFFCIGIHAQEILVGLTVDPAVQKEFKLFSKKAKKNVVSVQLPFIDDFSNYTGYPKPELWSDNSAFVSQTQSKLPPSTGVVTLDALDATGNLYPNASVRPFSGDTLTSQNIRLDSIFKTIPKKLTIADSIFLSFYFQPGGGAGDMWMRAGLVPSYADSLILEFFNPVDSIWELAWSQHGIPLESIQQETGWGFKYVLIPILKEAYLSNQFKFRFRNFCSLENSNHYPDGFLGNCDEWHIDYIRLDNGRNSKDTAFKDITFTNFAPSFLKKYQAMPSRQYKKSELADSLQMYITNLDNTQLPAHYLYHVYREDGALDASFDGGFDNINPFSPTHQYHTNPNYSRPPVVDTFPSIHAGKNVYTIKHIVKAGAGSDDCDENDTLSREQIFWNYYAYDDGSAENGYGLKTGTNVAKIAVAYSLNVADTLTSIGLYFNSTYKNKNNIPFYLTVWNNNNGVPGDVLYRSSQVLYPDFKGLNKYTRYVLDNSLIVSGTIFIGIDQLKADFINLGFDRNSDASAYTFYTTNGFEWSQLFYAGALMMRPYFGAEGAIGIKTIAQKKPEIKIYPNPAKDVITINFSDNMIQKDKVSVKIYNTLGQVVVNSFSTENINVSHLQNGFYILMFTCNGIQYSEKLLISR